jgi:hypothetical protein
MSKEHGIRLEPRSRFDKCIIGYTKARWPIYSWHRLVKACMEEYDFDEYDAVEWVDYNIVGLEPNGMKVSHRR